MKKKILSLILCVLMVLSVFPFSVFANENNSDVTVENSSSQETKVENALWEYEPYGDGIALTKYLGTQVADVYVPNKLGEYKVIKLAESIFENNDSINSITLASGILEIGNKAFYDCDSLVCILLSEELTTIGAEAFYSCDSFNSVILYDGITSVGEDAFSECHSLTIWCNADTVGYNYVIANNIQYEILNPNASPETIKIDGITYYIQNGNAIVVSADTTLKDVVIPSDVNGYPVTEIREAFKEHYQLTSVVLPNSLKTIGNYAFYYCSRLTSISIPEGVTTIKAHAFFGCEKVSTVTLYNNVTYIGSQAFDACSKITDVYYYGTLKDWMAIEFSGSSPSPMSYGKNFYSYGQLITELGDIFIGCTSINTTAFNGFNCVTKIVIPETVTSICDYAFSSCTELTELVLPEGLNKIGYNAFANCAKLHSIIIPESVTSIAATSFPSTTVLVVYENSYAHTFAEQNSLFYSVYDEENLPEIYEIEGIRYFIVDEKAIAIGCDTELTSAVVQAEVNGYPVTELHETFRNCKALASVSLPDSLTNIGDYAFYGCTKLSSITIPNKVTAIGSYAFYRCSNLYNVVIPEGVVSIGSSSFYGSALTRITLPKSLKSIGASSFTYRTVSVYYEGTIEDWCNITFKSLDANPMYYPYSGTKALYIGGERVTKIEIPESITKINRYAFAGNSYLTEIVIHENVTEIGESAFAGCTSLTSVTIPGNIKTISSSLFDGCTMLTDVTICEGVTTIAGGAFAECEKIEVVVIPASVTTISTSSFADMVLLAVYEDSYAHTFAEENNLLYAFYDGTNLPELYYIDGITYVVQGQRVIAINCDNTLKEATVASTVNGLPVTELRATFKDCGGLKSVSLPNTLEILGDSAFENCYALVDVKIPSSVTEIGNKTFMYCNNLKNIVIPNSVTKAGRMVFYHCISLENIVLSDSLTSVDLGFTWCDQIKSVNIPKNVTKIYQWVFDDSVNLRQVYISSSVTYLTITSFAKNTILMVEENSYAHDFAVSNGLLYFVLHKVENPEISYGAAIEGVVTNSDGTASAGATVEIYYEDGTLKESVVTDENGAYAFTYAEVGKYTIKAYSASGNSASTSVAVKRMNVFNVFISGDTAITLKAGYNVSGTVNVDNATVKLTDANGNVISQVNAENGAFTFTNVVNGTYLLIAETENGATNKEFTVYNGDVTNVALEINTNVAGIFGDVEVADRKGKTEKRGWVTVSVYDEFGAVVATTKSNNDGSYSFGNLPLGDYFVVATISEMRPDKNLGYDRLYDLYGYGYISLTEKGTYELDTIVLYEKNDYRTTVSGKANINKDKSKSCEFIMYNAFGVEYARVSSENGKYSFKNVEDGLYIVMAITENDGMGYAVITVLNGKVKGNTNINITKAEKIAKQEEKFENEVPSIQGRQSIEQYRERIADEKRFYDSLSEKEKNQLSKTYIQKLNAYIEYLVNCESNSGVENAGLVVSADEILNGGEISFTITVEKQEMWVDSVNGVETEKDFINHNMKDKAEISKGEIVEYYEISMTKTANGSDKTITSVYKDTDAMGKFRITLEIPEEYRGQKHYSLVHVHCGEVTVLADLDDNPDTITVEIDKFSTFALATTNEELYDAAESTVTLDDIIAFKGYSVGPNGTSICAGFDIDIEALEMYEAKTGETVDFGVVFASYEDLNGENPLVSETAEVISLENSEILKVSLKEYSYITYELILTDITTDLVDHMFTVSAYLYNGSKTAYAQGDALSDSVTGTSLNEIIG